MAYEVTPLKIPRVAGAALRWFPAATPKRYVLARFGGKLPTTEATVMTVSLSVDVQRLIAQRMGTGQYSTAEEVVAAALAALEQQDRVARLPPAELELLYPDFHQKILDGLADSDAGRVSDGESFFRELEREEEDLDANGRKSA
jgi:antitoxin ParD1/3/4